MNEVLIEIRPADAPLAQESAAEVGLELVPEGEHLALDGASLVAFSMAMLPGTVSLAEFVLRRLLDKRRPITLRAPGVTITASSMDDLGAAMEQLHALAASDAD